MAAAVNEDKGKSDKKEAINLFLRKYHKRENIGYFVNFENTDEKPLQIMQMYWFKELKGIGPDWEITKDEKTKKVYYINENTNQGTFTKPNQVPNGIHQFCVDELSRNRFAPCANRYISLKSGPDAEMLATTKLPELPKLPNSQESQEVGVIILYERGECGNLLNNNVKNLPIIKPKKYFAQLIPKNDTDLMAEDITRCKLKIDESKFFQLLESK